MAIELGIVSLNVQQIEEDKSAEEPLMYEHVKHLPRNLKSILVKYSVQFKGIGTFCEEPEVESNCTLNTIGVNDESVSFSIDTGSTAMIMTIQQFTEYEKIAVYSCFRVMQN